MPTVLRVGGLRFFFYAQDRLTEPPHVHVQNDDRIAKIWLGPVRLERSGGFNAADLRRIIRLTEAHEAELLEAWHEFGS